MNKFIYLLIGLLFVACAGQKSEPLQMVEAFPVEKSLFAEKVKVNEVFSLSKMMCKGNYLFASDVRSNENLIHQYSLPDFKCVYKGVPKGKRKTNSRFFLYL